MSTDWATETTRLILRLFKNEKVSNLKQVILAIICGINYDQNVTLALFPVAPLVFSDRSHPPPTPGENSSGYIQILSVTIWEAPFRIWG